MKKLLLLSTLLSGCATTGMNSQTGSGWILTDHYEGAMVTSNLSGRKRGEACNTNFAGLVTTGDASVSAAMKDGAITSVSSIDHHYKNVLFLYGKMCTIVTGN